MFPRRVQRAFGELTTKITLPTDEERSLRNIGLQNNRNYDYLIVSREVVGELPIAAWISRAVAAIAASVNIGITSAHPLWLVNTHHQSGGYVVDGSLVTVYLFCPRDIPEETLIHG